MNTHRHCKHTPYHVSLFSVSLGGQVIIQIQINNKHFNYPSMGFMNDLHERAYRESLWF
jgi:hypothetical protein